MPTLRKHYDNDFTIIPNQVIRDTRLSYKARGIFLYLWSLPDALDISLKHIQTHSEQDGQKAVRSGLKELEACAYLSIKRVHGEWGKFIDTEWTLTAEPSLPFAKMLNAQMLHASLDNGNTLKKYSEDPRTQIPRTEEKTPLPTEENTSALHDTPPPHVPKKPRRLPTDYTPGFLAWWRLYPADRRLSKPKCFEVWKADSLESRTDEVVEKLARLNLTTWKHVTERRFIMTSLPYLNAGRYEDELVPLPDIPVREDTGLSAQEYATALASHRILEEMERGDQRRQAIFDGLERNERLLQ